MKTKTNTRRACLTAIVLWAAFVSGTTVFAQSEPGESYSDEVKEAFQRLDALLITAEETFRYVPPSDEYDDLRFAWERLDMLASRIEDEIKYKVPEVEESLAVEFADGENAGDTELLSDIKKPGKNKHPR